MQLNQILLNFLSLTLILSLRVARSFAAVGFLSVAGGASWESSEGGSPSVFFVAVFFKVSSKSASIVSSSFDSTGCSVSSSTYPTKKKERLDLQGSGA